MAAGQQRACPPARGVRWTILAGIFAASLAFCSLAFARPAAVAQQPAPAQTQTQQPAQTPPPAAEQSSAPITAYTLPPAKDRKAVDYSRAQNWLYFGGFAYGLLILLLVIAVLLGTGIAALAGIYPARLAARLPIVGSLRHFE